MTLAAPVETRLTNLRTPALTAYVAHSRTVLSAAREAYARDLEGLAAHPACVVVRTCQRVELYVASNALAQAAPPEAPSGTVRLDGAEVARHLISVACGLESAVLGEDQVLHQLRQTYVARRAAGSLDPCLDRLFQLALQAGRRAHDWFGGERRSLGDLALEEIEQRVGSLAGRRVLIVGAGSMGRLTAVAASRRGAEVLVTNRTAAKAAALAGDVAGRAVGWPGDAALADVAGVVVALSGPWPSSAEIRVPVVDLSSPPATPHGQQQALGDRFVSVDDLAWGPETQLREGLRERLDALVADTGADYCRWLRTREALPAIQGMTEAIERRRRTEMEWLLRRLPDLSEEEAALVEQMSHRLVGGILHAPRSALNLDETGELGRAARELFGV